jgi:hypothetical protein
VTYILRGIKITIKLRGLRKSVRLYISIILSNNIKLGNSNILKPILGKIIRILLLN